MYISKHINKEKTVWMRLPMLREIFLGIFNRPLSFNGPEYQRLFLFQLNSASGNGLQFRSIYRKSLEIFPPTAQPSTKSTKKVSCFQTLVLNKVKWAHKRQRLL